MSYLNEIQNREMDEDEGHCIAHALGIEHRDCLKLKYNLEHIPTEDGFTAGYLLNILNGDAYPEIVDKITGLGSDNSVLLPASTFDKFNDYNEEYDAILDSPEVYTNFTREILSVQDLNELEVGKLDSVLKRQLFISLIGILETFLSTTFIKLILPQQKNTLKRPRAPARKNAKKKPAQAGAHCIF